MAAWRQCGPWRAAALALPLVLLLAAPRAAAADRPPRRKLQPRSGPSPLPIEARGLAARDVGAAELAEGAREWEGGAAVARRRFGGAVLAYVTPWHRQGYGWAVRFRGKLTHVSPVWYQLRTDGEGQLALVGGHEHNATWLRELREPTEGGGCGGGGAAVGSAEGGSGDAEGRAAGSSGSAESGGDESGGSSGGGGSGDAGHTCSAGGARKPPPRVLPRVVIELGGRELLLLLERPGPAIERLAEEAERRGYDGFVLDAWQAWAAMGAFREGGFGPAAVGFARALAAALRRGGRGLVLAVPPALPAAAGRPHSDVGLLAGLGGEVEGFSVMTYDHLAAIPGPNAPLPWMEANLKLLLEGGGGSGGSGGGGGGKGSSGGGPALEPGSVLLGLNFYGYEFSRPDDGAPAAAAAAGAARWSFDAVVAERFLSALARLQPALAWDGEAGEHYAKFKEGGKRRRIYFPTPASLAARVALAREWGVGLSIWELGQGMEAFFDLL
ncbi:hypothetical protein Rsub_02265 [Raphidocelis subcapitata]|uniref:Chitinase II/V-like catalytic domain-containing protein n=1 Tax=Raphidocelis subcapitata TaxID=307507 RepID=A0A2V0NX99_9CHLO|nr:hypothetical protein Rsub_02265 [Raphidocelis subcapitata]|eukprot:GBF89547.1 hypothetical protein Rsub_02265 [Raphidocelis subcapitata]